MTKTEFIVRLGKDSSISNLVSRYKEAAMQVVTDANRNLDESSKVNSANLLNDVKFEILEKCRVTS